MTERSAGHRSVSLRAVTVENYEDVIALDVAPEQQRFIAPNVRSLADAYVYADAEPLAVVADDEIVGFVLLYFYRDDGDLPAVNLVRLMIDHRFQGRGLGRQAASRIVERVRERTDAVYIQLSVIADNDVAMRFYEQAGFLDTNEIVAGEKIYRMPLDRT